MGLFALAVSEGQERSIQRDLTARHLPEILRERLRDERGRRLIVKCISAT